MNRDYVSNKLAEDLGGKPASVSFTPESREELRQLYDAAVSDNKESFMFQDNEVLVGYAKYLLQYLDMVMEPHNCH